MSGVEAHEQHRHYDFHAECILRLVEGAIEDRPAPVTPRTPEPTKEEDHA
ncbi:hypothetical protein [Agromyces larvae]|uniref:Uncharacterized protein n=1 Tax=Agromyces larvae TaxID=2929802 RepID=A0ABY4C666_9MICO|nr:hypothetical protein [Agromyces larvae]UOE45917.1 hypothetical protein MTO99_09310 [Agromyces larvae]